jgi:endo-1,4-beta-xylanase
MGGTGERIRVVTIAAVVGVVLVAGACKPLREYPAAKAMFFGTAARASLLSDPTYSSTLAREFGGLVPENELKWDTIHPQPTVYNFGPADALVNFARANGMAVRGVPLLWHEQNPPWLDAGGFTRAEVRSMATSHIATVVGRYKGRIAQWDVVNEPFLNDGTLRRTTWRRMGRKYMDEVFAMARAADPAAKLFLNERGIEVPGPKADAVFQEVSRMKSRGAPINGVGIQMHATLTKPTQAQLASQIARYASIGVEVAITEMDVALGVPSTPASLQAQADVYRNTLATCRAYPNCKTFVMWGFTDKYSWIPQFFPGFGDATVLNAQYGKKPAYDALNDHLKAAG